MKKATTTLLILLIAVSSLSTLSVMAPNVEASSVGSAPTTEISWSAGNSFPNVKGHIMFPTLAPSISQASSTHWYAGSVCSWWFLGQDAKIIYMSINVPYSAPRSDEFYYILLSAWTNTGSYVQIGFSDCYGTWGLTYSWTSGPIWDTTYHFSPNVMELSKGVTYTFYITTKGGVTDFSAYQGLTEVWFLEAPTGGDYLYLHYLNQAAIGYTNYEEVWQTSTPGGSPAFDFYFFNNYWVSLDGQVNAATAWWTWFSGAPSNVAVTISGNAILVDNPMATVLFETNPTLPGGTITFGGSMYINGQSAIFSSGNYSAVANAPTGYRFDHWEYSGYPGSGVYVSNKNDNPTTVQVSGSDGWLKVVFLPRPQIYIMADGSVEPPTAPILRNGNTYTLTNDIICSSVANCIEIYRDGIILDGASHSISGGIGSGNCGVYLANYSSNIVIRNLRIYGFYCGMNAAAYELYGPYIHNINIVGCTILSTSTGIQEGYRLAIEDASNVSACYIVGKYGIMMMGSNVISENTINASTYSISLLCGEYDGAYNWIYHNNFIGQGTLEIVNGGERTNTNTWDNGYPSGGNYWIYYTSTDTNRDGIGDAPYIIDSNNKDSYPLMKPWPLFNDGFESGNFSAWSGTAATAGETVAVSTALSHHGKYSGRFASNGGRGSEKAYSFVNIANSSELYVRGYIYVSQSGITGNDNRFHFIVLRSGTTPLAYAGWRMTNGTVRWSIIIRDGNNPIWPTAYSTSTPALNRWYCIELHWKQGTTSGLGELWVDGTRVCSITGKNTALQGSANVVYFGLADVTNCNNTVAYCDCAKIANTYIGQEPTIDSFTVSPNPFSPNGDGSKDTTTIAATLNVAVNWNLQVRSSLDTVLRTWTGTGSSLSVIWDGKNSTGFRVPDGAYTVRLSGTDLPGITFTTTSVTVTVDTKPPTVTSVSLSPASFSPRTGQTTKINYTLSESCYVTIKIYNSAGTLVRTLVNNVLQSSGARSVTWDGKNSSGTIVPSGTYTIRISVADRAGNKANPYPIIKTVTVN